MTAMFGWLTPFVVSFIVLNAVVGIVTYGNGYLLVAADGVKTSVLCLCMIGTYYVMVLAEEPWLERIYGEAYRQYCRNVPRFFHWRRLARRRDARA